VRVVVVGSGSREHALADLLAREGAEVVVAPGNAGIARRLGVTDAAPESLEADLVVVGPEAPLVAGLADRLRAAGTLVVGPGAPAARLEGSKVFMKRIADAAGVPTAPWGEARSLEEAERLLDAFGPPYVIKTDGLAAGKGVLVTADRDEALADAAAKLSGRAFGPAGERLVIEAGLRGRELSVLWLVNEVAAAALPVAQDHKRLGDGDVGPNTGGMGAYAPVPWADADLLEEARTRVLEPILAELARRGITYRGFLYAGLMATSEGLRLLEINVRLGDPEAQVLCPLLGEGALEAFLACARGEPFGPLPVREGAALGVVVASRGYPDHPEGGDVVTGIEEAERRGAIVYAAGLERDEAGVLRSRGGRVLTVVGLGVSLAAARSIAYDGVGAIHVDGARWRRDLGLGAE